MSDLQIIEEAVAKNGATVVAAARYPHPSDYYLYYVLAEFKPLPHAYPDPDVQAGRDEMVVWTANIQQGGLFHGSYFSAQASKDYRKRAYGRFVEVVNIAFERAFPAEEE